MTLSRVTPRESSGRPLTGALSLLVIVVCRAEGGPAEEKAAGGEVPTGGEHWQCRPYLEQRDFA